MFNRMSLLICLLVFLSGGMAGCKGSSSFSVDDLALTDSPLADTTPPTVSLTNPVDAETDVAFNRSLTISFSEEMQTSTIDAVSLTLVNAAGDTVNGSVALDDTNRIATFVPDADLDIDTLYTATITTEATDLESNGLADDYVWEFTTGSTADVAAPSVTSTTPADLATDVAINASINATFDEEIATGTLTTESFTVVDADLNAVDGSVVFDSVNNIASFTPDSDLDINATYTATVTTVIEDLSGNALASDVVWNFTTGTTAAEESINLESNNAFAILAGSTVTSTGFTIINGDLGLSPGTAVTGFPPGILNGSEHAGDTAAAEAMQDLTDSYNDAAGRTTAPVTVSGNLGGTTLAPGLYKSTSSLEISSGDLTLDAQGDASAVFIFQMASTLTTTAGRQVILSGGAKATNVYWQVGTSATLGTDSVFKGNIMADQSITLTTGADLEGRALTRIGAVALDSNTVTIPAP